jgi:hypothetical protein
MIGATKGLDFSWVDDQSIISTGHTRIGADLKSSQKKGTFDFDNVFTPSHGQDDVWKQQN